MGWSLAQRSPTECGVYEYDCKASMRRPWLTSGCCAMTKKISETCFLSAAQKIKYESTKTLIVPVVFYRCETWKRF
jgi:hypothetical protein